MHIMLIVAWCLDSGFRLFALLKIIIETKSGSALIMRGYRNIFSLRCVLFSQVESVANIGIRTIVDASAYPIWMHSAKIWIFASMIFMVRDKINTFNQIQINKPKNFNNSNKTKRPNQTEAHRLRCYGRVSVLIETTKPKQKLNS